MEEKLELLRKTDLKNGEMKEVSTKNKDFLVARIDDKFFITDSRCPHMGGSLVKGTLEGNIVTCPLHGSQFDIRDGRVIRWTNQKGLMLTIWKLIKSPRLLKTYKSELEGDTIYAKI